MKTYLDYAATTPLDPRVVAAMQPYFSEDFGNPSSVHLFGQRAEAAVEASRLKVAEKLGCSTGEIVFTSGGTESDNLALRGAAMAARRTRGATHILISPVEHPAVSKTASQLAEHYGFEVELLRVDGAGTVDPEELAGRVRPDTAVVSIIHANNEIGTINPIPDLSAICTARQIPFHTDSVQAGAHLKLDIKRLGVDLLSLGAHKFYGPKGVGVSFIRKGTPIDAQMTGGGQENGVRSGTSNVAYIVGFAEAFSIAQEGVDANRKVLAPLRDRLIGRILEEVPETRITGSLQDRLPNHASFVFRNADGNHLLMLLDQAGFACSSGSACKTGLPEPSEVLLALGLQPEWALGSLRVTLGRASTPGHIEGFLSTLPAKVAWLRQIRGS